MRALRCLLPLLALGASAGAAGCFDDHGVVLEIDVSAAPNTTQVELFLSQNQCPDNTPHCTVLKPKDLRPLVGAVWYRDAASRIIADVKGHKATFKLEAHDETDSTLSMLIALGTDSSAAPSGVQTLTGLVVPAHDSKIISTSLTPAAALVAPDDNGVMTWVTPPGAATPSSCLVVAQTDSVGHVTRTFIVPEDDRDCDGTPNQTDCVPNAYLDNGNVSTVGPGTSDPARTCATAAPAGACQLGTIGCADDEQDVTDTTCRRQFDTTCLPMSICGACPNGQPFTTCPQNWPTQSYIDCTVPMEDVDPCDHDATISVSVPDFAGGCDAAELTAIGAPLAFDKRATFGGVELDVSLDKKSCTLKLTWKGGDFAGSDTTQFGLIRIGSPKGSVLVPLTLHFNNIPVCSKIPLVGYGCSPSYNEASLWSCLQ